MFLYPRRPSGLVGNHEHLCEEVMSSIFVKTRICVISSLAESERMLVSKIQPLVDEL